MVLSLQKNGNTASIQAYTLLMLFEPLSRVRRLMQLFLFYGYWKTIEDVSINNEYEYENDFKPYSYSNSFSQLSMVAMTPSSSL